MAEKVIAFRIDVKGTDKQTKELGEIERALISSKEELRKLNQETERGSKATKKQSDRMSQLRVNIKANTKARTGLENAILKQNKALLKNSGFVAGIVKGLKSFAFQTLAVVGGARLLAGVVSGAFKIFVDFQKANSKLAAILDKTKEETIELTEQAKQLGSSTAFTAREVTELQTSLARLGFPIEDIKNMTSSTLDAAAAMGSGLAEQAALTGATLKSFGLNALDATRVNDILSKATTQSALDFSKLSTALPIVGATADAVGVNLERTTALLGTLADRGVDASTSATSLRNIFLELEKRGLTFEEAMAQINSSTNKASTSFELFGKRGATAGVILSSTQDATDELTKSLLDADDAAKDLADTMLDDVAGDITKAESAYEGMINSIISGDGVFSDATRTIIQFTTTLLSGITAANDGYAKTVKAVHDANIAESVAADVKEFRRFADQVRKSGDDTRTLTELSKSFLQVDRDRLNLLLKKKNSQEGITKAERSQAILLGNRIKAIKDLVNEEQAADTQSLEAKLKAEVQVSKLEEKKTKKIRDEQKKRDDIIRKGIDKESKARRKAILDAETLLNQQFLTERLAKKEAIRIEFEDKIQALNDQNPIEIELIKRLKEAKEIALDEQQKEFDLQDEAKRLEARQLELQNQLVLAEEDFAARRLVLEKQRQLELQEEGLTKSQIAVINKKFNDEIKDDDEKLAMIKHNQRQAELAAVAGGLDAISGLLKDGSKEAKILASASALINTYAAAAAALDPPPIGAGPVLGPIIAGTAIASGLANIAKINNVKFAEGGLVNGPSHAEGGVQMYHKSGAHMGEMEGEEYVINKDAVRRIGVDNLDALNFGSGSRNGFFQDGGVVPTITPSGGSAQQQIMNMEVLAQLIRDTATEEVSKIQVVNTATDTIDTAKEVINTESDLSFG